MGGHYAFDELLVGRADVEISPRRLRVAAPPLAMALELDPPGALSRLLGLRPRRPRSTRPWMAFEDAVLRPAVGPLLAGGAGIRAQGRTRAGSREWYVVHAFRTARAVTRLDDVDLGAVVAAPASGFGFSEFPPMPAAPCA